MNKKIIVSVFMAAALLTGCNDEPSQGDIENILNNAVNANNDAVRATAGKYADKMLTVINSVEKKGSCTEESDGLYTCTVETDLTAPIIGRKVTTKVLKFTKQNGDWAVVQ